MIAHVVSVQKIQNALRLSTPGKVTLGKAKEAKYTMIHGTLKYSAKPREKELNFYGGNSDTVQSQDYISGSDHSVRLPPGTKPTRLVRGRDDGAAESNSVLGDRGPQQPLN